ncbi:MAG TPA: glycosyltransferase [Candidatus Saccharibacteria bacterium]|nr:glycosyltransferase [Candidatus Saccharibacteria bacterium]HRQ07111.1 glycosyltransferase [Candidatus Saccharibacteria bacterium]
MKNRINVIVPVYGDKRSLEICLLSLKKHYKQKKWLDIYFVNDVGPEADTLEKLILNLISDTSNFQYHRNSENLGFVKNVNNATFNVVKDKKADVLLLNSDTEVKRGAIEAMNKVLLSNDKIAVVNPKTNGATMYGGDDISVSICVPLDSSLRHNPEKSYRLFKRTTKSTSEYTDIPVYSGFCALIRRKVIDKIGLLDEAYDKGYFDDNDMSMRVYQHGYRCVVSNRAFVTHFGSKSFSDIYRIHQSEINKKIFLTRYPDFTEHVNKFPDVLIANVNINKKTIVNRISGAGAKLLLHIHNYGLKSTIKKSIKMGAVKLLGRSSVHRRPMVQVWSHEVTETGAPLVLKTLLHEWRGDVSFPSNIEYVYPAGSRVDSASVLNLVQDGFNPRSVSELEVNFVKGDVVLLNSALPHWLYEKVIAASENGTISHAYIYMHENNDMFLVRHLHTLFPRMNKLISGGKMTLYSPSVMTTDGWKKAIGTTKNMYVMSGKINNLDSRMFKQRTSKDFNKINFILSGSSIPRKGALSVVYAINGFYNSFYTKDKQKYRDFTLTILGVGDDEYFYNDFIKQSSKSFADKINLPPRQEDFRGVYDLFSKCNFTITYSVDETYSIVTIEGMSFGHPIIRSEVPGLQEQLKVGKNGWLAPTTDWWKLVEAIEEVLNKTKTSNDKLQQMSQESINIAEKAYNTPYRFIKDYREHN